MEMDGQNSRSCSQGKAISSMSGEKVLPHYLRPFTGSCHDICKYGRKHEVEQKPRRPFPKRIVKKPSDNESKSEFQPEGKMKLPVRLKHSSNSNLHAPNTPEIIKREVSTTSVGSQTPVNEVLVGITSSALAPKTIEYRRRSWEVVAKKTLLAQEKLSESVDSHSSEQSNVAWAEKKKKISSQGRMKVTEANIRTMPELKARAYQKMIKQDISSSSEKLMVFMKLASTKAKEVSLSSKHASHPKPNLLSNESQASNGKRNSEIKMGTRASQPKLVVNVKKAQASLRTSLSPKTHVSKVSIALTSSRASLSARPSVSRAVKVLPSPRASMSLKTSLPKVGSQDSKKNHGVKGSSALKSRSKHERAQINQLTLENSGPGQATDETKEVQDDIVQEKTLYVIETKTLEKCSELSQNENPSVDLLPPPSLSPKSSVILESPSLSSDNREDDEELESEEDAFSEYDETQHTEEVTLEGKHSGVQRVTGMFPSESKDVEPVKLCFRRGKVVDIQSENNGLRRLKFRRGRILDGKSISGSNSKRSFRRRQADGDDGNSKVESEKVVLRHQDVQGKKDAKGLFNNVIEETASKLVETRKSKVKALVGAFETVISLQDGAPPSNTVS